MGGGVGSEVVESLLHMYGNFRASARGGDSDSIPMCGVVQFILELKELYL